MRLRSLRKLEEMELRKERDKLDREGKGLQALVDSPARQRSAMKRDLEALGARYARTTPLGARRTSRVAPERKFAPPPISALRCAQLSGAVLSATSSDTPNMM